MEIGRIVEDEGCCLEVWSPHLKRIGYVCALDHCGPEKSDSLFPRAAKHGGSLRAILERPRRPRRRADAVRAFNRFGVTGIDS